MSGAAVLAFAAFAAFACTEESPTAPPPTFDAANALLACGQTQLNFHQWWGCNSIISVGPAPGEPNAGITNAIDAWHDVLHWDALPNIPEIVYRESSPAIKVSYEHSNGNNTWCAFNGPTDSILLEGMDCEGQLFGDVSALITHEFAEILGLDEDFEVTGSAADCTVHISGLTSLNSRPCAQEVEFIFAGYGLTTVDPSNIWDQTVVTRLSIAAHDLTVEQNASASNSVTSITVDPPGTAPVTASASQATYSWTAVTSGIVTLSPAPGGRTVTIGGFAPGTTYVRVTVAGTSVSNGVVGTVVKRLGDSVKVVVPAPPPTGTNFRVSDITGPPVPITEAGIEGLHAVVEDPYNEYYQVKWDISYSNGSHAAVHSDYYPSPNYTLQVPAGSYKITVTATARSEGHFKSHTSYFPVCTGSGGGGGGGDLLRAQLPDSQPDAGTDAVGGC
jgi:hypothetical protein